MRMARLTLSAFLSIALLASTLEAQQPMDESSSSRRAVQQTSFSVLSRGLPQAETESHEPIERPPLEVGEEIVRVAQYPSGMNFEAGRPSPTTRKTVVLQSPTDSYPPVSFVEYHQSSFSPAIPLSELQGPTFGDTYFLANPVDEWAGFCNVKSVRSNYCGCNFGNCTGGCGGKTHRDRKCERKGCRCGACQSENGNRCQPCNCSNCSPRSQHRDHKCRRGNGKCGCDDCSRNGKCR